MSVLEVKLTPEELDVLEIMFDDMTVKEMGAKLSISEVQIKQRIKMIFRVSGCSEVPRYNRKLELNNKIKDGEIHFVEMKST